MPEEGGSINFLKTELSGVESALPWVDKVRTHARKLISLSPPSSLQQIPKFGNT